VVAPLLALTFSGLTALPRALIVTLAAGLIWQFAWVLIVVRHEQGSLRSPVIKKALWLNAPSVPHRKADAATPSPYLRRDMPTHHAPAPDRRRHEHHPTLTGVTNGKEPPPMITIDSLSKKYGGHTVVHDISFTARNGRVTGFLGPNGAGKSTSMRMMVGLTTPTEGTATISGRHFADLPNPGREVGVMLDASAQHAGRTGREILTIAQQIMDVPARRVTELLDLVSLAATEADRRVGNYSLGMRQRLGIAAALIGDPSVLILDEPANGLDPAGIRWMRDLLRDYADHGGTVLLSSHLLTEIEIIADDTVMIGQGRIVSRGSKAELLAAAGTVVRTADVASTAGTPARRTPACSRAGWPDGTSPESSGRKPSATGPITRPALRPEPPSVHGVGIVWRAPRLPTQISAPCVRAGPGSATGRVPSKCDATPS
jgi:ABC-2 type transport system ATP-binding protein